MQNETRTTEKRSYRFIKRRRREENAVNATFVIPAVMHDFLREESERQKCTMSALVRSAINDYHGTSF